MTPHKSEDLVDDEPPAIEPYKVLGLTKTATADEVKSAYRKAALKHHPDKAAPDQKDSAHTKFQKIVFAYGVLSDPTRRKRYDTTGSTSESVDFDGVNWSEYYRSQFADAISSNAIEKFSKEYKNSTEEKDDILNAYRKGKGRWSTIYEMVMLSDPLEDEDRFRGVIDEAIRKGEVEEYKAYTNESQKSKDKRMKTAEGEEKEAMAYAEELGVAEKLFGKGDRKKGGKKDKGENGLTALIKSRQADRASFFDHLEAKYAAPEKKAKGKKGNKRASEDNDPEMPSEEAFQAAAARLQKGKKRASEDEGHEEMPSEEAFQAAARRLKNGTGRGSKAPNAKKMKR